jgi:hypothetical protein
MTVDKTVVSYGRNLGLRARNIVNVKLELKAGRKYKLFAWARSGNGLRNGYVRLLKKVNGQWKRVGLFIGKYQQKTLTFVA